jgi:UDP-N-acetylmuramate--alanine ligase
MINKNKKIKIYFIGIGGIGMSGIAELMHKLGYTILGSDIKEGESTKKLRDIGIIVKIGHNKKNLQDVSAVVFSSAINKNNPEILEAKKKKIPIVSRADMLGELMKNKKCIAVAGSHGKTTTTSLVANILETGKLDPTIVNGGIINSFSKNNKFGKGEWMVVEADESDGSFLKLPHQISIITNLDIEHLDYYKYPKNLYYAFEQFIMKLPFYGISIINEDDKNLKKIIDNNHTRKIISFSNKNKKANIFIKDISFENNYTKFKLIFNTPINNIKGTYSYRIKSIGIHNVFNGTASIIAGLLAGVKNNYIKNALVNYIGVKRRFTHLGKINLSDIYDDYAHHPTEIAATLSGAKQINKNIIVVFQPHRYSRTKILFNDFISILSKIHNLFLLDTYSAGEKIIRGFESKDLYQKLKIKNKKVFYLSKGDLNKIIYKETINKNIIIFMGAGSISNIANNFIKING